LGAGGGKEVQEWITTKMDYNCIKFDFVTGCQEIKISILMRPAEILNISVINVSKLFTDVENS